MIYTVLPVGSYHGWGVCGKYIVKELSGKTDIKLLTEYFDFNNIGDELDYRLLKDRIVPESVYKEIKNSNSYRVEFPVLQSITGNTLKPECPNLKGTVNVGYTFFEDNILPEAYIENGRKYFDVIVTGSAWCEEVLRGYGLKNVTTIIQGIDPTIFNPLYPEKEYFRDRFVVFSGGKFELRKGQDIVIKAFKHLQDRYKDVMIVNSWFNHWPESLNTMRASPHITFNATSNDYATVINQTFADNGVDLNRVITLPPYPNIMMQRIYKNSDVGLFPNRCEGGTNLVLMEYMACGKPVIASYNTGHKDVLTEKNSIRIEKSISLTIANNNTDIATWEEPNLDETIEKLEWAYNNRTELRQTGKQAGEDLSKMTWQKTAQQFYDILKP